MLKLNSKFEAKCPKHPGFNPAKQGVAEIKGGCEVCLNLVGVHNLEQSFLSALQVQELKLIGQGAKIVRGVTGRK